MGVMERYEKKKKDKSSNATTRLGVQDRYELRKWAATQGSENSTDSSNTDTNNSFDPEKGKIGWEKYLADKENTRQQITSQQKTEEKEEKPWWEKAMDLIGEWYGPSGPADTTLPLGNMPQLTHQLREDTPRYDAYFRSPNDDWKEEQQYKFGELYLESPEKAYAYAKEVNKMNLQAKEDDEIKKIQRSATASGWGKLGHTAGALLSSSLGMADYLNMLVMANAGRDPSISDGIVSPFEYSQAVTEGVAADYNSVYGTLDESIPIIGGKGWGDVYGLGTSIAQSAISGYTQGPLGTLVSYFGQGAASGMKDALERGASTEQAALYGTALGAFEGVAEQIGIDNLFKLGSSSTIKGLLKNILNQAKAEGLEEGLTSVLSNIADVWVMKDKSNFNTMLNAYMEAGMSEDKAKWAVFLDSLEGIAFDMIAGAASGGIHGGVHSGIQTGINNSYIKQNYGDQAQDIVSDALNSTNANVQQIGQKYQDVLDKGNKLSGWNLSELLEVTDTDKIKSAAEARLTELGEKGNISQIADILAKQAQGLELTNAERNIIENSQFGRSVSDELNRSNLASGEDMNRWAENIGTRQISPELYNKDGYIASKIAKALSNVSQDKEPKESKYKSSESGKTTLKDQEVSIQGIESIEGGEVTVRLENGEVVNASDLEFGSQHEALMYDIVARMDATPETANSIFNTIKPVSTTQASMYYTSVPLAYEYGKINHEAGLKNINLPKSVKNAIFTRGRIDAMIQAEKNMPKTDSAQKGSVKTNKKGIIFEGGYKYHEASASPLQKASMQTIEFINAVSNLEVHIYESKLENGKRVAYVDGKAVYANGYFRAGNKIYIDINAGQHGEGLMLDTLGHEVTHYIRENNAKGFKAIADFLIENYGKKGVNVQERLDKQKQKIRGRYARDGEALPSEAKVNDMAYEELVADAMSEMFNDPKAVEKLSKLKQENRSAWETLRDAIKKILDKIKSILDQYKSEKRKVAKDAVAVEAARVRDFSADAYEKLQDLYIKAFVEADANYEASVVSTKTTSEDVKHSDRDSDYLDAVNRGDMVTAQKMVDEAAKKAGYTVRGLHATNAEFTVFDISKTSDVNYHGRGIYFTNSQRDVENNYENYEGPDPWQKIEGEAYELLYDKYGLSYEDTLTSDSEVIDKLNECYDEVIEKFKKTLRRITAYLKFDNPLIIGKRESVSDYDLSKYDGIIDKHVYENIGHSGMDENTVHYIVLNPNNIKSADPVTYDDNGNVIPLSERFKADNNDIRYSFRDSESGMANDALSPYNEELTRFIGQRGDYIVDSFEKLEHIVNLAFDNPNLKATAYFGIINVEALEKIKNSIPNLPQTSKDILFKKNKDYSIATTLDAIRHIVDEKALSREDVINYLDRLADTILEFDSVNFNYYNKGKDKVPGLLFKKNFPDGVIVSFDLVSHKKRSISMQTLYMDSADYQKKKSAETLLMQNASSNTSKTQVGQTSVNSIPQNTDSVKREFSEDIRYSDREIQPITEEEYQTLEKHFGVTGNFRVAGYLLPNGKLLDFSGKHWGDTTSRSRQVDHRDVNEVLDRGNNGFSSMVDMIGSGNIRLMPETGGINLAVYPNEKQRRVLSAYINYMLATEGQVIVDYDAVGGDTVYSRVYEKYASSRQILSDIRNYFNGAIQSDLMSFHTMYSDRDTETISNRTLLANALDTVAQNDIEKTKLAQYREKIALIESEQAKLSKIRAEIKELSFAKGPRDTARIKSLQFEANQAANRINTYDRQLLNLESTKALKGVLDREKAMARKKAEQMGKESLRRQKEKDAATVRELLARNYESRKKATESRNKTAMRHKIRGVVSDLNKLLLNPTKDQHVPIGLQKVVADALDAINMDTMNAEERVAYYNDLISKSNNPDEIAMLKKKRDFFEYRDMNFKDRITSLKSAYAEFKESDDPLIRNAHNDAIEDLIKNTADEVGNNSLKDMSLTQLERVYDMYKAILATVRNANKMFKEGRQETVTENSDAVKLEVREVGGHKDRVLKMTKFLKKFGWDMLKPVTAMKVIGSKTFERLFKNVRAAEDTWAVDVGEAKRFYEDVAAKYGYNKWDMKKRYSFKDGAGSDVSMSLEQIMSLYAYSKREQADKHLEFGGFIFDDAIEITEKKLGVPLKYEVNDANPHRLRKEDLFAIIDALTKEQKGFVDEMQTYLSDVMGAKGNEVSLAMYDIKLYKEKNYFPLKTSRYFREFDPEKSATPKIKNSGFSKKTVPQAGNPIVLSNFMDVWAGHVNDMSMYHAFVLPLEDFMRVYNYSSTAGGYDSVQQYIKNAYGSQANQYIEKLMDDLNGGARVDSSAGVINKGLSLFKKASVFASASVVVQQPSAMARALAYINPKYFATSAPSALNVAKHKTLWEEVKKYAPVAVIKEMGYFDTGMGRSTVEWIKGNQTIREKLDDVLSKAPAIADELCWTHIWEAIKRETQATTKFDVNSEEFLERCGQRFTEVITNTQVYDSVLSRSGMMRSKDTGMKMATAFMAEPTTTVNMMVDGILQGKRGNKSFTAKTVGAVSASIILNSILVALVYAARDDDEDETYLEKYVGSITSELLDGFNPLTYIPFVKDIWSIAQGYDVERSDMSVVSNLWSSIEGLFNENTSGLDKVIDTAGAISSLFGIPLKNILRDAKGMYNLTQTILSGTPTTGAGIGEAVEDAFKSSIPLWDRLHESDSKADRLYKAILSGDQAHIDRVKATFKDQSAIDSALKSALRANDSRIHDAAQARLDGNISEYTRIAREIIAEGHFSQDIVVAAINSEMNTIKKGESTQTESADTKDEATSIYRADDINIAFDNGDTSLALSIIDELVEMKMANGMDEKKAKSSIRSSMTSYWKPLYKQAYASGNTSEMQRIKQILYKSGLYGSASEVIKDVNSWLKN